MAGVFGVGALGVYAMMHIILLLFSAGYSGLGDAPRVCGDDVQVESWACDTPFEAAIRTRPDQVNFFARAAGVLSGIFGAVFGFLAFNYPILRADGVMGIIGVTIQMFSWMVLVTAGVAIGLRMFGRG